LVRHTKPTLLQCMRLDTILEASTAWVTFRQHLGQLCNHNQRGGNQWLVGRQVKSCQPSRGASYTTENACAKCKIHVWCLVNDSTQYSHSMALFAWAAVQSLACKIITLLRQGIEQYKSTWRIKEANLNGPRRELWRCLGEMANFKSRPFTSAPTW
jgi:hypothetical protein